MRDLQRGELGAPPTEVREELLSVGELQGVGLPQARMHERPPVPRPAGCSDAPAGQLDGFDVSDKPVLIGTNGNITAPPLFADAAAGDFHELAGSPTIARPRGRNRAAFATC